MKIAALLSRASLAILPAPFFDRSIHLIDKGSSGCRSA
jgi:hypothetical protein